jgi:transposase
VLTRRRLPEGLEGITRLHALIAERMPAQWADLEPGQAAAMVKVGIESDRGPWVAALIITGYEVFAVNPMSAARYRQRHSTSGAKSDTADAHLLAEIVRLDRAHHRPVAGNSHQGEAIKLTARTHQSLVWDRTRHVLRLRSALRDFFPAALTAFPDLDAPDALELLRRAPDPDQAARLTKSRISAALRRASRRDVDAKTAQLQAILGAEQLRQPPVIQSAYAAIVTSEVAVIEALNTQIDHLGAVVNAHFGPHPDAEIYPSQPGLGAILAARVLGEFGTTHTATSMPKHARATPAPHRSPARRAPGRSCSPATPATDASGTHCSNGRSAQLRGSPGARAYYQQLRDRNIGHQTALRQLANRLVGILHGCLKTQTRYDEHTAWNHHKAAAA